jgi:hypothetical protein
MNSLQLQDFKIIKDAKSSDVMEILSGSRKKNIITRNQEQDLSNDKTGLI